MAAASSSWLVIAEACITGSHTSPAGGVDLGRSPLAGKFFVAGLGQGCPAGGDRLLAAWGRNGESFPRPGGFVATGSVQRQAANRLTEPLGLLGSGVLPSPCTSYLVHSCG